MAEIGWIWLYIHQNEDLKFWKDDRIFLEKMIKLWDSIEGKLKLHPYPEFIVREIAASLKVFDDIVQMLLSIFKSEYSQC